MDIPFKLPVRKVVKASKSIWVYSKDDFLICKSFGHQRADYIVHVINSHKKLVSELRASDNWLRRLLKSCVILLDDGEVTKRAVEKQLRYNQQALEAEKSQ